MFDKREAYWPDIAAVARDKVQAAFENAKKPEPGVTASSSLRSVPLGLLQNIRQINDKQQNEFSLKQADRTLGLTYQDVYASLEVLQEYAIKRDQKSVSKTARRTLQNMRFKIYRTDAGKVLKMLPQRRKQIATGSLSIREDGYGSPHTKARMPSVREMRRLRQSGGLMPYPASACMSANGGGCGGGGCGGGGCGGGGGGGCGGGGGGC